MRQLFCFQMKIIQQEPAVCIGEDKRNKSIQPSVEVFIGILFRLETLHPFLQFPQRFKIKRADKLIHIGKLVINCADRIARRL